MSPQTKKKNGMHFPSMAQKDVPLGRNGKHKRIVAKILSDLDRIDGARAIKIPLEELDESKENVRSALNRASRKDGRRVATASDDTYLYVWNDKA